ncbi:hypothetical protein CLTEP_23360 [Clostridium tepidiprofundi DSM 19306]|uniref:LUD domain-containing protein n=1 Tax=Clostridium tepidiprofundi DSM 19306 TaxID=1121338 RepID=A0A151AVT9_9CLOT|nr:lactate utilization protein [Clostridium tepidiprofundi]KYH31673.1 hypothetical protein CLTEP_23360 [Clostridium tepidiprofundi DSM 19306]
MDSNVAFVIEKRIERTINNLEKNNMNGYFVKDKNEAIKKIEELINEGDTVAIGGSMTLFEIGAVDLLRNGKYNFLDRYKSGLSQEQIKDIYRKAFSSDVYLSSSNALTEDGELYNVDGRGNRVAAMIYGPDKVIVVVGINKIVRDLDEAIIRNREIAAPANAKRLNKNTPCAQVGHCMDCNSTDRICNEYVVIRRQMNQGRIHVIIINEELGY